MANKQPTAQTIAQHFQQQGLVQWWQNPTQRFGQGSGQYGTEEGTDFAVSLGTPIGSITSGKVLYVGTGGYNDPSLGYIVQVQGSNGSILHYQHLKSTNLKAGQTVGIGSVIGLSGGQPGRFSSGPHIEVRYANNYGGSTMWLQHWLDSYPTIKSIVASNPANSAIGAGPSPNANSSTASSTTTSTVPIIGPSFQFAATTLSPSDDVTQVLWTIDEVMQLVNPANVINAQQDTFGVAGVGVTFTDPVSWVEGFLFNLGADLIALTLRAILLLWGLFLGYKVLSSFVDFKGVAASASQGINLAALLAA